MKTIYNIKALCVMALLGSVATVSAQEDKTKEKNLNREMTLEREYDPTVQDASKVNTLPVIKEPVVKKMAIDYATFTVPARSGEGDQPPAFRQYHDGYPVQQTPRLFQLRRRYVSEPERRLRLPHPEHGQG